MNAESGAMADKFRPDPFKPGNSITHPFSEGQRVRACRLVLVERPLFFFASIKRPVPLIADMYEGWPEGDPSGRLTRFFAHPSDFQTHQAEAALLLHFRATMQAERFYPNYPDHNSAAVRSRKR
jgi:hypothetical protein